MIPLLQLYVLHLSFEPEESSLHTLRTSLLRLLLHAHEGISDILTFTSDFTGHPQLFFWKDRQFKGNSLVDQFFKSILTPHARQYEAFRLNPRKHFYLQVCIIVQVHLNVPLLGSTAGTQQTLERDFQCHLLPHIQSLSPDWQRNMRLIASISGFRVYASESRFKWEKVELTSGNNDDWFTLDVSFWFSLEALSSSEEHSWTRFCGWCGRCFLLTYTRHLSLRWMIYKSSRWRMIG